ncbi:ureidoglycolate hydrolase [Staphylotrichum tortipilum]|uniref:Ureidoglycolate hydrolase n=1 Tax=Staphylotrichum tortipilum TaxID=2831512 RepID=A0AAN6MW43_9PEZI|nr:ureidoglycolate hydrolase [Staphylotrichum longicolle]
MQSPHTIRLSGPGIVLEPAALIRDAFAPFGDVVENPRPDIHPSAADKAHPLPFDAVVANQGSAVKYQHVSRQVNLYDQAPSGRPGSAITSMFVCAARARIPDPAPIPPLPPAATPAPDSALSWRSGSGPPPGPAAFPVAILERHPYTTQTFMPLTTDPTARYLVIVAPSLPPAPEDTLPGPTTPPPSSAGYPRPLPGSGMPDLRGVRAFVAHAAQAVTYGAGTWHAPMVALGEAGTAIDFVVVQFANGVGLEDCQEVLLEGPAKGSASETRAAGGIVVNLAPRKDLGRVMTGRYAKL